VEIESEHVIHFLDFLGISVYKTPAHWPLTLNIVTLAIFRGVLTAFVA
jgi:hypothetical protein